MSNPQVLLCPDRNWRARTVYELHPRHRVSARGGGNECYSSRLTDVGELCAPPLRSSADLWIASNYCTSSTGCSSTVPLFNSSLSRTQVDMNTSFSVRYGSGQAQGEMMQDFVAFAGYNVSSQAFALVESVSQDLLGGEISGLMGAHISSSS